MFLATPYVSFRSRAVLPPAGLAARSSAAFDLWPSRDALPSASTLWIPGSAARPRNDEPICWWRWNQGVDLKHRCRLSRLPFGYSLFRGRAAEPESRTPVAVQLARFIIATPAFASGRCLNRWEAGHGAWPLNSITWPVSRAPPACLPYLEGTQNRFTARPRSGPGPRGSSPSRATSARPNRYRRPPLIPGPDQGSREGDAAIVREAQTV